jgi:hypothetical protein
MLRRHSQEVVNFTAFKGNGCGFSGDIIFLKTVCSLKYGTDWNPFTVKLIPEHLILTVVLY